MSYITVNTTQYLQVEKRGKPYRHVSLAEIENKAAKSAAQRTETSHATSCILLGLACALYYDWHALDVWDVRSEVRAHLQRAYT